MTITTKFCPDTHRQPAESMNSLNKIKAFVCKSNQPIAKAVPSTRHPDTNHLTETQDPPPYYAALEEGRCHDRCSCMCSQKLSQNVPIESDFKSQAIEWLEKAKAEDKYLSFLMWEELWLFTNAPRFRDMVEKTRDEVTGEVEWYDDFRHWLGARRWVKIEDRVGPSRTFLYERIWREYRNKDAGHLVAQQSGHLPMYLELKEWLAAKQENVPSLFPADTGSCIPCPRH